MSIESALFTRLRSLVADRCYPSTFPQDCPWPAIRYSIVSSIPFADQCGDGEEDVDGDGITDEVRVQIDAVAKTYDQMNSLRRSIRTAMQTLDPPAALNLWFHDYDSDLKRHRAVMDYTLHPSSE